MKRGRQFSLLFTFGSQFLTIFHDCRDSSVTAAPWVLVTSTSRTSALPTPLLTLQAYPGVESYRSGVLVDFAQERLGKLGLQIERLPGGHLTTNEQPEALAALIAKFERGLSKMS